jgi:hypothetical protein
MTIPPMKPAGDMGDPLPDPASAKSAITHPAITIRVPGTCMKNVFFGVSSFI